jgi:chorismate mutase/prephenate dehydratase
VLANHDVAPSGKDKTSIVMTSLNKPGAMVELLEPLSRHGVSMTKFESRPSKQGLWDYVFFVDLEGHITDAHVKKALQECEERASMLKVLGSYPAAVI